MYLSKENQDKLTIGIQAGLSAVILGLSVYNSAKVQSASMKKAAKKNAKELQKYQSKENQLRTRLMKEKYKKKLKSARKGKFLF